MQGTFLEVNSDACEREYRDGATKREKDWRIDGYDEILGTQRQRAVRNTPFLRT